MIETRRQKTMKERLVVPNGMSMYILSKLTQDFKEGIFCEAKNDTISLIGARNHLTVLLKLKRRDDSILGDTTSLNWNYSYVFKSEEVRRNINWFHTKANARMQ